MQFFQLTFQTMLKLALISTAGFFVFKINFFKKYILQILIEFIIIIALPCMLFYSIISQFNYQQFKSTYFLILYPVFDLSARFLFSSLITKLLKTKSRKIIIAFMTFSNSGYLPVALVSSIFPIKEAELAIVYISLYLILYNLIQWSWGVHLLSSDDKIKFRISPPLIAILTGIVVTLFNFHSYIPAQLIKITKSIGSTTSVLIMIMVGATMSEVSFPGFRNINIKFLKFILIPIIFNLILYPLIIISILRNFNLGFLLKTVLVIEACTPPALNLIIIAKKYGDSGSINIAGPIILISYIASIITIPIMFSLVNFI